MFFQNRKLGKAADAIGSHLHRQLRSALEENDNLLGSPYEMAFTTGYISAFFFTVFSELGCKDYNIQSEHIKKTCNRVLPDRLWDIFQRGEELNQLSQGREREEFVKTKEAYDLGVNAAIYDAFQVNKGIEPNNFTNYLLGKPISEY